MTLQDTWVRVKEVLKPLKSFFNVDWDTRKKELAAYRLLALRLQYEHADERSSLLVTPNDTERVAQCCVMLSYCISEVLQKRVLLVDISKMGSEISRQLGHINRAGEKGEVPDRKNRFFTEDDKWYFYAHEGPKVGPFKDLNAAKDGLEELIKATVASPAGSFSPSEVAHDIRRTEFENVSFLPLSQSRLQMFTAAEPGGGNSNIPLLLKQIKGDHGYLLFYGGSLLDNPSALAMAPFVGSVLLTATEAETRLVDYDAVQNILQMCGVRRIFPLLIRAKKGLDFFQFLSVSRYKTDQPK